MRIALIASVHAVIDVRVFYKEACSLVRGGHTVTLFTRTIPNAEAVMRQAGVRYMPLYSPNQRWRRPIQWLQLIQLLLQGRFDVWHFHNPELLPLLVFIRRAFVPHVRLIYDVHEDVPKDIMSKPYIPIWLRQPTALVADVVERWCMKYCDLVVAATDAIQRRCNLSAARTAAVHNYPLISDSPITLIAPTDDGIVRVIYLGGLAEVRGIRDIVQAMALLRNHPIELILLGSFTPTAFEAEIRQEAGPNVHIISQVPFTKSRGYLMQSDIGIVCFWPEPNHIEAMPNKLFEYMEAGLPIIASDFPLWREIVARVGCGLLVNPQDPPAIAAAILQLAHDKELRQTMGAAGRRAVYEHYSWQAEERTLLAIYDQLAH